MKCWRLGTRQLPRLYLLIYHFLFIIIINLFLFDSYFFFSFCFLPRFDSRFLHLIGEVLVSRLINLRPRAWSCRLNIISSFSFHFACICLFFLIIIILSCIFYYWSTTLSPSNLLIQLWHWFFPVSIVTQRQWLIADQVVVWLIESSRFKFDLVTSRVLATSFITSWIFVTLLF